MSHRRLESLDRLQTLINGIVIGGIAVLVAWNWSAGAEAIDRPAAAMSFWAIIALLCTRMFLRQWSATGRWTAGLPAFTTPWLLASLACLNYGQSSSWVCIVGTVSLILLGVTAVVAAVLHFRKGWTGWM